MTYHKLSKRFYGLFQIKEHIAYRLNLPSGSMIHPVFHCSLLKLHKGPLIHNTDPLPPNTHDNHPLVQPLAILDRKWDTFTSPPSLSVLVQWLGLAPEDTSWEKWDDLQHKFHLEGKVVLPKEGDDRNAEAHSSRPIRMT